MEELNEMMAVSKKEMEKKISDEVSK